MNERLGALLPEGVEAGMDITPLTREFLSELLEVALIEQREEAEAAAELRETHDG